ncbi:MAG: porin family protein [Opitutae bacterium]|nr:porin family protein [Opitutae bacterium]
MIRLFIHISFLSISLLPQSYSFGQSSNLTIAERLAELKVRSSLHEGQIAQLLAEPTINRTNFDLPVSQVRPIAPPPAPRPSIPNTPFIPVPEYVEVKEVKPVTKAASESIDVSDQTASAPENKDLDDAYAKLYEPDVPSRLVGYYFGPILGLVFPKDGAIRVPDSGPPPTVTKKEYEADSGFLLGLQVGKDFGGIRVEAEYSYHSFDASTQDSSLSASIHNFFSRLILEKELGDRFDLRTGIGMGMGIVGLEGLSDYSGTGFAYDFTLGAGYRLAENWSIQADYRYFLTAAHDQYDHIKSHLWVLSASLDL